VCTPSPRRSQATRANERAAHTPLGRPDPLEEVASVAAAKRELLLRVHRFRLRHEDLEDCFSQATLELMLQVRRGGEFASLRHISNTLEQRFLSRVRDRRRALAGRSPMIAAVEAARRLGPVPGDHDIEDVRVEIERLVFARHELMRLQLLARELTPDQRLAIAGQVGELTSGEFCARFGWTPEKYRKVAQRARARLRALADLDQSPHPSSPATSSPAPGVAARPVAGRASEEPAGTRL
jgi:hypothetical protein